MPRTKRIAGGEHFKAPCEFLDDFQLDDVVYDGLYAYFAHDLDQGSENGVREYLATRALDTRSQSAYSQLLASVLGQQRPSSYGGAYSRYRPQIDASVNYLKFRFAVGVMEPVVSMALSNTESERKPVRILRTIVAAQMVRGWIDDVFVTPKTREVVPEFISPKIEGRLDQHFEEAYSPTHETAVAKYLGGSYRLVPIGPDSDEYRFFDIKDFSHRVMYAQRRSLPTIEEVDEMMQRHIPLPEVKPKK